MDKINELQAQILEHKSYLYETDYVVIRNQETGQTISDEIKANRASARSKINLLEDEIKELEKQINNVQL